MKGYFSEAEISCPCCNLRKSTTEAKTHLDMLNNARSISGIPFNVNSWTRCVDHNLYVHGSPTSSHLQGIATDISFKNHTELFTMVNSLLQTGFKRILIYPHSMFIHVDSDSSKTHPIFKIME